MNGTLKNILYMGAILISGFGIGEIISYNVTQEERLKLASNTKELSLLNHHLDSLNMVIAKQNAVKTNYEKALLNKPDFYMKPLRSNYDISDVINLEKK